MTHRGARLTTEGAGAPAIFAQSVGGGGGRGGNSSGSLLNPSISVGGTGGAGGNGGNVTVTVLAGADITTSGASGKPKPEQSEAGSSGIFAQSAGGGGGIGGNAKLQGIPGSGVIPGCTDDNFCGKVSIGIGLPINLGGGIGGDGGAVALTVNGNITTTGDSGAGVFAQSVGGSGGLSGATAISPIAILAQTTTLIGSGSAQGSGGVVTVDYTGNITTPGGGAHGIFAQTNDNQDAIARHIQSIYGAQALDGESARGLIAIEDTGSYARVMNSFGAEIAVDNQISSLLSGIPLQRRTLELR